MKFTLKITPFFKISLILLLVMGCLSPPDYPETPKIKFISVSSNMVIGEVEDVSTTFSFTDGDGDIGYPGNLEPKPSNVFVTDSRDDNIIEFSTDYFTPEGNIKAISGEITINISPFCLVKPGIDTLFYTIQLQDRAGHWSNSITTPIIFVNCN